MKRKQGDIIRWIVLTSFVVGLVSVGILWQVYRYQDCKLVGHTKLYCIMNIGK